MFVIHPLIKENTIKLRSYQESIFSRAIDANTLVVLPTGLGKTIIAAMVSAHRLQNFPESKILFLAPTKPLAVQHQKTFSQIFNFPILEESILTGIVPVKKREEIWNRNRIIFATPQTIENEILRGLKLEDVSLTIFDECVVGDTKIKLGNSRLLEIKSIENLMKNREVYVETLNQKTGEIEPRKVLKFHKIKCKKKLVEIKTAKHKIKVTEDHLFLVKRNRKIMWRKARELKLEDEIAVLPSVDKKEKILMKETIVNERDIIKTYKKEQQKFAELYKRVVKIRKKTKDGVRNISKKLHVAEGKIKNWINSPYNVPKPIKVVERLKKNALIPLKHSTPELNIIARFLGHIFGDGWLRLKDNEPWGIWFSGKVDDLKRIQKDLDVLGIKYSSIYSRKTKSSITPVKGREIEVKGLSNSFVVSDPKLVRLIFSLGVPTGDKTSKHFVIPKWLMNATLSIKKEFLSALMGSEGTIPRMRKGRRSSYAIRISFNKIKELEKNGKFYGNQLKKLFQDFGLQTTLQIKKGNFRKDGTETTKFQLTLSNSNEQLERFLREISYTYNIEKRKEANQLLEYLKYKKDDLNRRKEIYKKAQDFYKRGIGTLRISKLLNINDGTIMSWIYSNRRPSFTSPFVSLYEDWKKVNKNFLSVGWNKIKKIKKSPKENYVYDLTIHKNHNYIANNFVVHNCHRAIGSYAYVFIAREYIRKAKNALILGLTASPSSDNETVNEICKNLFIQRIEAKTDYDRDVIEHIKKVKIEWLKVELPEEFKKVKNLIEDILKEDLKQLKIFRYLKSSEIRKVNKKLLLETQSKIRNEISQGLDSFSQASIVASAIKINHALELLETQGISSLNNYFERLQKQRSKAIKRLFANEKLKSIVKIVHDLNVLKVDHPKLDELAKIVRENKDKKVIIFTQYRDSVEKIIEKLNEQDLLAHEFIGQATKGDKKGMTQKEQIKILENFKEGKYNALVATSVAEEGLDIPKVDLVIFYEPIPSDIRSIQRRGRTGRTEAGRVIILMAKNTRDEGYFWASYHKEKKMREIVKGMKEQFEVDAKKGIGQQSLLEYSNNNSENAIEKNEKKIKIYVDARERNSKILEILREKSDVEIKQLEVGDFILSERVGVERKNIEDFLQSIIDKRLFTQAKDLARNFQIPMMIIEGPLDLYSLRDIHPNAIRGALISLTLDFGIFIIPTRDEEDTGNFLLSIAKREQEPIDKEIPLRGERKPLTLEEMQRYVIESLPNVSAILSKRLLEKFKSVKGVMNASEKELMKIEGIGKIKAEQIRRVIMSIYNGDITKDYYKEKDV